MVAPSFLKEFWVKRLAQASTVAFLKTSDPKRLPQIIEFLIDRYLKLVRKKKSEIRSFRIYLYKVWGGLYKVNIYIKKDEESGKEIVEHSVERVRHQDELSGGVTYIRGLSSALSYLDEEMESNQGVVSIFWGLYRGMPQGDISEFTAFLRNMIFSEEYYARFHTSLILMDSPEALFDQDTLKHSIVIDVPLSTEDERREIIARVAEVLGIRLENGTVDQLIQITRGLNLHETESVLLETIFKYKGFNISAITRFKNEIVKKSGILDIEEPSHGFEAIGGYEIVKEFIKDNVIKVLKNPKVAKRLGLSPPRGILLFGPPGTGKTLFALSLSKELGIPFLRLRIENIVSMWYGEATRNIARAIKIAESVAPAILFIDEIDKFGRRGGPSEHEESRRMFSVLLEWLGDKNRRTIVIGTTNRISDLDEAFMRVGRFDYIIPFLYPDKNARLQILKVHTSVVRKVPLDRDVDLNRLAEETELWSGAEIEELVKRAARQALKEGSEKVGMDHFLRALNTFRIDMRIRRDQLQRYMAMAERYTNDAEFLEQLRRSYKVERREEVVKKFI